MRAPIPYPSDDTRHAACTMLHAENPGFSCACLPSFTKQGFCGCGTVEGIGCCIEIGTLRNVWKWKELLGCCSIGVGGHSPALLLAHKVTSVLVHNISSHSAFRRVRNQFIFQNDKVYCMCQDPTTQYLLGTVLIIQNKIMRCFLHTRDY